LISHALACSTASGYAANAAGSTLVRNSNKPTQFGAEAFAEHARVELKAAGGRTRKPTPHARDELTPQEAQLARRQKV
jgi:hypothetical protein